MGVIVNPPYWLVLGLAWPSGGSPVQEAALAVAPATIPRSRLSPSTLDVLAVGDSYVANLPRSAQQVVFFAELTRWLDGHGQMWADRGTDWEQAIHELERTNVLGLFLQVTQVAHAVICDASRDGAVLYGAAAGPIRANEIREDVRQALFGVLMRDWAPYASQALMRMERRDE